MKEIPLTQGQVALVDDADFEALSKYKWSAQKDKYTWYALRTDRSNGTKRTVSMHRQIMGAQPGQQIDHRNRKGLDNQRHNLRFCTDTQNNMNAKKRAGCTSQYKGVSLFRESGKWRATIKTHGEQTHLGLFDDEIEAALAYNAAAIKYFGEFARINVI